MKAERLTVHSTTSPDEYPVNIMIVNNNSAKIFAQGRSFALPPSIERSEVEGDPEFHHLAKLRLTSSLPA
jgi:hypothetical protein